ncbi:MAG: sulfatase-like hydrolase/transferase [Candidatus Aminicenantes bacterium]|nr:MAG: sulfatase-like hydrolase/transferase [Candidatus Aminicenantes bacterium]
MSKRALISILVFIILVGIFLYIFIFKAKPSQEALREKTFKSFQTQLESVEIEEMNIILFTIDTLRADRLECYGYQNVKTPNINRLAKEGILFEHTIAQAPLTLPSHSSIFTGTNPLYHGIRDNGGFYLDESHVTLAEALKNEEFATGAFVGAFVLDSRWGLDQGFDYYYDNFDLTKYKKVSLDAVQRRGDEVMAEAYKWLDKRLQEKFFAWIHLYDPHTPYEPPEPYKTQYKGRAYGQYDGEIAYVDQLIGEFHDFLEEKGLLEKTLIVFTADHGESLGEHKESAHGFFIYDSDIRIPLIIRFPQKKFSAKVINKQVRSIDIMPTVLHLINTGIPEGVQGESLLSLILGENNEGILAAYSETYWPRYHYGWSELKSIREGRYKFIDAPKPELYDVSVDPGELDNLIESEGKIAQRMKEELEAFIEKYSSEEILNVGPKKVDNDSLIKLQALGYIGSFHTTSKAKEGEKLGDPKDKIELYNEIKLTQFLVTEEKLERAEEKIKGVLEKDASVLEARYILGNIYSKQNKFDQAISEYKIALEVDSDYYEAIFGLALAYKRSDKINEAIVGFNRLIEIDPKDTKPFLHLGEIYEAKGELDEAERYLKSASVIDPENPVFRNKLGAVYLKKNMYDAAEREIQAALSIERSIPLLNAHFNLALLHEARGEFDRAVTEYKKEQEASPFNHKPDFNLGLFYAKTKELDKAIEEFESCIQKNEDFPSAYVFLAKAYMDSGKDLEEAARHALKGLSLNPDLQTNILAHFILADIYNRLGRHQESRKHVDKAKKLQKTLYD